MQPNSKWLLHCTQCYSSFDQHRMEPDVICQRCGGRVEITEQIIYNEKIEGNINNDIRSH